MSHILKKNQQKSSIFNQPFRNTYTMYDEEGIQVWERPLDRYGKVLKGDIQAGYDSKTKTLYLKKPTKTYDAMHESFHAKQHNDIGDKKYNEQSRYDKEKHVHNELMKNKDKLSDKQINHADAYMYKVERGNWPPYDKKNEIYIL